MGHGLVKSVGGLSGGLCLVYIVLLPSKYIAVTYGYTGYKLCMYECVRAYVRMGPTALKV